MNSRSRSLIIIAHPQQESGCAYTTWLLWLKSRSRREAWPGIFSRGREVQNAPRIFLERHKRESTTINRGYPLPENLFIIFVKISQINLVLLWEFGPLDSPGQLRPWLLNSQMFPYQIRLDRHGWTDVREDLVQSCCNDEYYFC